jgi:membrane protein DedA with SNARE-associated domain
MEQFLNYFLNLWALLQARVLPDLGAWSYLLLALLTLFEGPISTLLAAAMAASGVLNPLLVFLAAAAGNLTGDSFWYSLGYFGKIEWIARLSRWLGVREGWIAWISRRIKQNSAKLLFVAKLTNSVSVPTLITAGLMRVRWRRCFLAILAAEILWTGTLVSIGYFSAESIHNIQRGLKFYPFAGLVLFALAFLILLRIKLGRSELSGQSAEIENSRHEDHA